MPKYFTLSLSLSSHTETPATAATNNAQIVITVPIGFVSIASDKAFHAKVNIPVAPASSNFLLIKIFSASACVKVAPVNAASSIIC